MDFELFTASKRYLRNSVQIPLSFDFNLQELTRHNRKTFDDCQSLLYFLQNNPEKQIFLTRTQIPDFLEEDNKLVLNIEAYQAFCKKIGQNGKNRTQAFLAQRIKHYSDAEKKEIIANSTEEEIIERIRNFTTDQKKLFLERLKNVGGISLPQETATIVSNEAFLEAFALFLGDPIKKRLIINNYPQIQINILEGHRQFLIDNLDKEETFIQDWIYLKINDDGSASDFSEDEIKKIKKSRCLIFGLEYISHKREGVISSKQFDILTRVSQGKNDYVLIELKSPNGDIFHTISTINPNGGQSIEYRLSNATARDIQQISDYRYLLENATDVEWQQIGLPKGRISKCIIIIGTKHDDSVWLQYFSSLRKNLSSSIEVLTYSDLIEKLETTLNNLKENL